MYPIRALFNAEIPGSHPISSQPYTVSAMLPYAQKMESALGRCDKALNADQQGTQEEKDYFHLRRVFLLSNNLKETLDTSREYIAKYPQNDIGWIFWIMAAQMKEGLDTAFNLKKCLDTNLKMYLKGAPARVAALRQFSVIETVTERTLQKVYAEASRHPNSSLWKYVFLSTPHSEIIPQWRSAFDHFMDNHAMDYAPELLPDILIGAYVSGLYTHLLNKLEPLLQKYPDHLSLQFLKLMALFNLKDQSAIRDQLALIKRITPLQVVNEPLFLASEKARTLVMTYIEIMMDNNEIPPAILVEFSDLLGYIMEHNFAIAVLKKVTAIYKDDAWLLARLAALKVEQDTAGTCNDEVIKDFEEALRLAKIEAEFNRTSDVKSKIHTLYGHALITMKKYEEALYHFEQAPEDHTQNVRIKLYMKFSDFDKALAILKNIPEPYTTEQYRMLGDCYMHQNKAEKALQAYNVVIERQPTVLSLSLKSTALIHLKRYKEAREAAAAAIKLGPRPGSSERNTLYLAYALSSYYMKDFEKAYKTFQQLEAAKVLDEHYINAYCDSALLSGHREEACRIYNEAHNAGKQDLFQAENYYHLFVDFAQAGDRAMCKNVALMGFSKLVPFALKEEREDFLLAVLELYLEKNPEVSDENTIYYELAAQLSEKLNNHLGAYIYYSRLNQYDYNPEWTRRADLYKAYATPLTFNLPKPPPRKLFMGVVPDKKPLLASENVAPDIFHQLDHLRQVM